jgi:hypothetical protein
LRKIPVLRLNFPRLSAREIFRLSTGIFRKYPSQTWYICSKLTWYLLYIFLHFPNLCEIAQSSKEYSFFIVCNLAVVKYYRTLWTVPFSRYSGSISICFVRQWLKYSEWIWWFAAREGKQVKYVFANTTAEGKKLNPLLRNTSGFQIWLITLLYV